MGYKAFSNSTPRGHAANSWAREECPALSLTPERTFGNGQFLGKVLLLETYS